MLELFFFFFFQTDRCVPFRRRSWRWDCQCLSWTEKGGGGQSGQRDRSPKSLRADACSLPSTSPRQGRASWNKEKNHLNCVLIGSFWMLAGDFFKFFFFFYSIFTSSHLSPAAAPRGLLSSGSGRSATGSPCGAILWSLPTGWSAGGPGRPQTASGGCRRCRRRRLRWCARAGWGWWCGWACCSWRALAGGKAGFGNLISERSVLFSLLAFQLTVVEVKPMEVHSLHQITQPLRLERGQAGITDLAVNIHKRVKMSNLQICLTVSARHEYFCMRKKSTTAILHRLLIWQLLLRVAILRKPHDFTQDRKKKCLLFIIKRIFLPRSLNCGVQSTESSVTIS